MSFPNNDSHNTDNTASGGRRRSRRRRSRRGFRPDHQTLEQLDLTVGEDQTVIIGLTGAPGAGKTSLAARFAELGATVLDADAIGHEAIQTPATKKKLVTAFGDQILDDKGAIDRQKLADAAFVDNDKTATLNTICHPRLVAKLKTMLKKAGNFVVIDAALLHELGLDELCTMTVYVRAPFEQRCQRVAERGWDKDELDRRQDRLGDADARRKVCHLTVDNNGDPSLLEAFAKTILARCKGIDLNALRQNRPPGPDGDDDNGEAPAAAPAPAAPQIIEPVTVRLDDYLKRQLPDLQEEGERLGIRDVRSLDRHGCICEILRLVAGGRRDEIIVDGFIEKGFKDHVAYLRSPLNHYLVNSTDTFIPPQLLRRYGLRAGMHVTGVARAPRGHEPCPQMINLHTAMGHPVDNHPRFENFEDLVPLHAEDRLFMERDDQPDDLNLRIIDLIAPIGKGQRGLIVSQPKCGKTVYLQKIANAITHNNPEVTLIVLLVDERPEEVTDMQRSVQGEVIASTFDQRAARHVQCAEITITKAKRLVEQGKDVVILLDSITRLARAYNTEAPSSGRIMSGGIESGALIRPKQFFGAARNIENGGSLTILATALVETGSVMDTVIFEEFKGTGNMELVLDRRLANRRVFPAVDVTTSGTRKDDLLIKDPDEMRRLWALRKFLAERSPQDAIEFLKGKLGRFKSNIEFLMNIDPDKVNAW